MSLPEVSAYLDLGTAITYATLSIFIFLLAAETQLAPLAAIYAYTIREWGHTFVESPCILETLESLHELLPCVAQLEEWALAK